MNFIEFNVGKNKKITYKITKKNRKKKLLNRLGLKSSKARVLMGLMTLKYKHFWNKILRIFVKKTLKILTKILSFSQIF